MQIHDFANENIFKILNTQSRRADLTPGQLSKVHVKLGELISYKILQTINLEDIEIQHVQGIRKGIGIASSENILLIAQMRSGLFVSEGIKEIFDGRCIFEMIETENDLPEIMQKYGPEYNIIVVDSVINTGKTMKKILDHLVQKGYKRIFAVSLVINSNAVKLFEDYKDVELFVARTSDNFYKGEGNTDTGNRLFGNLKK